MKAFRLRTPDGTSDRPILTDRPSSAAAPAAPYERSTGSLLRRAAILLGLVLLTAALLGACSSPAAPAQPALVAFRLDAATCRGEAALTFYIDGATVGAKTLSAGASEEYVVRPGDHIAAFAMTGIPIVFTSPLSVLAGQRFTLLMTCVA
jgi:hypothetical protein